MLKRIRDKGCSHCIIIQDWRAIMNLVLFTFFLMGVGVLIWLCHKYIPVTRETRRVLTIVFAVIIGLWTANFFDLFDFI